MGCGLIAYESIRLLEDLIKDTNKINAYSKNSQEYKMVIEREETENERKYRKALEKQQRKNQTNSNLKIVGKEEEFLNKDETMIQVVRESDCYCDIYKIPSIVIYNNEWDSFFDILYRKFLEKGLENKFYDAISEIVRFTFAKSLLNITNSISIKDFIDNLYCLQNLQITKKEILILQNEILLKIQDSKVINFANYRSRKK